MSCYFFRIGVFLRTELGREVSKEELKIHCCGDDRMQGFFKFFKIKMAVVLDLWVTKCVF